LTSGRIRFGPERPTEFVDLLELELARQLLADPDEVRAPMRRLVEAGGKRLRPNLVALAARLGPNRDTPSSTILAAAVELIHCATLIHDDYVDESPRRRGRPTVAALEGPERAVAVGDYYFAKATRMIAELGSPDVTSTIAHALEAICLAQIDDYQLRGSYPGDRASYLKVVRGKTAALIAASCAAGAQLADAEVQIVGALRRYGEQLGTAFQMADDVLDYSGLSGKPAGQDIRERVVSLPLIYASEDREVGAEVRRLLAGSLTEEDVRRVQDLVVATGALQKVNEEARALVRVAVGEVEALELDGVRSALVEIAHAAVDRSS
jgi:geranylgeranyl pyrophosphate synthase